MVTDSFDLPYVTDAIALNVPAIIATVGIFLAAIASGCVLLIRRHKQAALLRDGSVAAVVCTV